MSTSTVEIGHSEYPPDLADEIRSLERRLERGWQIIDEKKAQGQDVDALEGHWLSLLSDYQTLCDRSTNGSA